jgi:hypothetical protein
MTLRDTLGNGGRNSLPNVDRSVASLACDGNHTYIRA